MSRTLAFVLSASLASLAACGGGQAEVHYSGDVTTPELVTMESDPSVMIVANADEPVFYSENTYYLYRDQRWYRSSSHRGGWARADEPPEHIRRIERPTAYVHIRRDVPQTTMNRREQPAARTPEYRGPAAGDPSDRDRVEQAAPPAAPPPAAPPPRPAPDGADRAQPDRPDPSINRPEPVLRGPGYTPGSQRPSPNAPPPVPRPDPTPGDRPEPHIAPDPDRAPTPPGQPSRTSEQRASERDDRREVDPTNDPARPSYK